jgi:hypothetical protein
LTQGETASIRVLFIAGMGRSGTTLLSNILGQAPGCLSVGELRYVWERGIGEDHRCGCGEPFSQCQFWTQIMARAFGGRPIAAKSISEETYSRLRVRRLPIIMWRRCRGRPPVRPNPDDAVILRVYQALANTAGVKVIVDSSKLPAYALLLSSLPGVDLHVVHVIRDPRAIAFSWRRDKMTRDKDHDELMARLEIWRTALLWLLWSLLADRWWPSQQGRSVLVRYEDFIRDPPGTITRILDTVDIDTALPLVTTTSVTLAPTHTVAGNPNRHDSGTVLLAADEQWKRAMPARHRWLVTAITWPGLRRFGYRVRS